MNIIHVEFTASPVGVNEEVLTVYRNIIQTEQGNGVLDHVSSGQAIGATMIGTLSNGEEQS